jgi:Zn-dependent protease/CBS domain-containing protein
MQRYTVHMRHASTFGDGAGGMTTGMSESNATQDRKPRRAAPETPYSLHLVTVSGIPIRVHITFGLLLAYLIIADNSPNRFMGVLYVLGIFTCVVLHELGHSIVAQRFGIGVSEIVLYPIGGVARLEKLPGARQELWIALAGPAVNLVIAAILFVVLRPASIGAAWGQAFTEEGTWPQRLLAANLILALFNLIPAFPMDGGRILRALLALRMGEVQATQIAASIGQILALGLGFLGLVNGNFILLAIAFFVFIGAGNEVAMYQNRALVEGVPVRDAMITDFRTLEVGATLGQAADLLLQTSQTDFPVIHGGETVGVLDRRALLQGMAEQGRDAYVAGSMQRNFLTAKPDADLQELASEMQTSGRTCAIVTTDDKLLGMVTMENLAELLVVRQIMQQKAQRA